MRDSVQASVAELIGVECVQALNGYGSILTLDFGDLSLPADAVPQEQPRGWRSLTVYSPWRVENGQEILFDWNVDGGVAGKLPELVKTLVGGVVAEVSTAPPGWDLTLRFDDNLKLVVFGDSTDDRDDAWFILSIDGTTVAAIPRVRSLA